MTLCAGLCSTIGVLPPTVSFESLKHILHVARIVSRVRGGLRDGYASATVSWCGGFIMGYRACHRERSNYGARPNNQECPLGASFLCSSYNMVVGLYV